MAALLVGLERVAYLIDRCRIYELLYLSQPQPKDPDTNRQTTANLERNLVSLYAVILGFIARACSLYRKDTLSRAIHGVLHVNEATDFVKKCEVLESDVDIDARICESELARADRGEQAKQLGQILKQLREPMLRVGHQVSRMHAHLDETEQAKILMWISNIPYKENHITARQGRTEGTGVWLIEHERYLSWRKCSTSTILWLHGFPGAGKTKLVSKVIDSLQESLNELSNDETLAYFYCDRNQIDRQDPELLLRSLVRQLSVTQTEEMIQPLISQRYYQERKNGFATGELKFEESLALLAQLIQSYPQVTLVIDALDECDKLTRVRLIDALDRLIEESSSLLKIFISSRPDGDIKDRFALGPNMEIRATDNRVDIIKFVNNKLEDSIPWTWKRQVSASLKVEIAEVLIDKSDGM